MGISKLAVVIGALVLLGIFVILGSVEEVPPQSSKRTAQPQLENLPPCTSPEQGSSDSHQDVLGLYFSPEEIYQVGLACYPGRVAILPELDLSLLKALLKPDDVPSIDTPQFDPLYIADQWLADDALVLTLVHDDIARAYPVAILNWHEIVNDKLGDLPVAITFCPLCNSGVAFERPVVENTPLEYGTSGRFYKTDLVMYDRTTGTFWSQIAGRAIMGPLVSQEPLRQLAVGLSRWSDWRTAHPETQVLSRPTTAMALGGKPPADPPSRARPYPRNYNVNPYESYLADASDTFGTPFSDGRLGAKELVAGVRAPDSSARAYLKRSLESVGLINDHLGELPILVLWNPLTSDVAVFSREIGGETLEFLIRDEELVDSATNTLWSIEGRALNGPYARQGAQLEPVPAISAFWFVWLAFHPATELFLE